MRANEIAPKDRNVTINIPITITIPSGGGDPAVSAGELEPELPPQPVMVTPLQQELELDKHGEGKRSAVLSQILDDDGAFGKHSSQAESFNIPEDYKALKEEFIRRSRAV